MLKNIKNTKNKIYLNIKQKLKNIKNIKIKKKLNSIKIHKN